MSLLKVGDGKNKLEIDVCGRCLSVWCDKGEYETLTPPLPKSGERFLDFLSCGVGPIAACLALGAILGRRSRKLRCTAL